MKICINYVYLCVYILNFCCFILFIKYYLVIFNTFNIYSETIICWFACMYYFIECVCLNEFCCLLLDVFSFIYSSFSIFTSPPLAIILYFCCKHLFVSDENEDENVTHTQTTTGIMMHSCIHVSN